jgi:metacaspase-1
MKLALCIGINDYPGSPLAGCVNDALHWSDELDGRGYQVSQLLDQDATRDAMLTALMDLVADGDFGDRLVITYSGHGSWVPDRNGDEADQRDEVLCPVDLRTAGPITDDELYAIFTGAARGVRVMFIADSCHSGTLQRFAPAISNYVSGDHRTVRFLPPALWLPPDDLAAAQAVASNPSRGRFRRSGLVLSACRSDQVTYDVELDGKPQGLFSYVALRTLREGRAATFRAWHAAIRMQLPSVDYPDVTPQLDGLSYQRMWPVPDVHETG